MPTLFFFQLSPEWADTVFNWSNYALFFGAGLVAVATYVSIRTGSIRDFYSDVRRVENEHQTAFAKDSAAQAIKGAEIAKADAAKAGASAEDTRQGNLKLQIALEKEHAARLLLETQAAEAMLKLEQVKTDVGARHFNRNVFLDALKKGGVYGQVEIFYSPVGSEPMELAQQIGLALQDGGWTVTRRDPIPISNGNLTPEMAMSGQPKGVTVAAHAISLDELKAGENRFFGKEWYKTPFTVLTYALEVALGGSAAWAAGPNAPTAGTLRIIVAPRI